MNIADKELLIFFPFLKKCFKQFLRWCYNLRNLQTWVLWCIFEQESLMTFLILKLIPFICLAIFKRQTFIYSSLSVKRNIFCFSILSVKYSSSVFVLVFSINILLIDCSKERVPLMFLLKYFRLKINELSRRWLDQIYLPLIARFQKFSSYACHGHPKFAYLEAYKYYLLSAFSSEASRFFLISILYRIKREPELMKKAVFEIKSPCLHKNKFCLSIRTVF